jgi:hypothetical protein
MNQTIIINPSIKSINTFSYIKDPGLQLGLNRDRLKNFVSYDPLVNEIKIEAAKTKK